MLLGSKLSSFLIVLLILVVTWGRCELRALIHFKCCQGIELEVGTKPKMISSCRFHWQVWNQPGQWEQKRSFHLHFSGQVNTNLMLCHYESVRAYPILVDPEWLFTPSAYLWIQFDIFLPVSFEPLENTCVPLQLVAVEISCFRLSGLSFKEENEA